MSKKVIIISILIISFIISILYFSIVREPKTLSAAIKAVPSNSFMLIEVKNYQDFSKKIKEKTSFWEELNTIDIFKQVNKNLDYLDSTLSNTPEIDKLVQKKPLLISYNIQGKSSIQTLYILELTELISEDAIHQFIKNTFCKNKTISHREYNGTTLYTAEGNKQKFSYAIYKGLLLYSESSLLLEKSIRQIDNDDSLIQQASFKKAYKTSGEHVDLNIYFQIPQLQILSGNIFDKKFKQDIVKLSQFANWSEFDIDIDKSLISANGFTISKDSINNYLNIFKQQNSSEINVSEILPSNTSTFLTLNLSDVPLFFKKYRTFLKRKSKDEAYKLWIAQWKKNYNLDIPKLIEETLSGEITLAYTQINKLDLAQNNYFILKVDGESETMEALQAMLNRMAEDKNITTEELKITYQVKEGKETYIYPFPQSNFAKKLLGDAFATVKTKYFTFIDNYWIFANSVKDLKTFIDANERQTILDNDVDYNQLQDDISSSSSIYFYSNISISKELYKHWFNEQISQELEQNFNTYKKFHVFVYQLNTDENMLYSNVLLKYNPIVKEKPRTTWECKLNASLKTKPKVVINHRNNQKEIFIQDNSNTIYLISKSGKILWKRNIEEPILNEVKQIDCYKNNKLQYIFNTSNKLFIVDRNGNDIEHFPVNLRAKASAGVAVFDYDKSRDYRFFVPCEDKKIYVYNIDGNILPGWKFGETETKMTTAVQHFRIKDSDYIVFSDQNKSYFLNRRGEEKIKTQHLVQTSKNNIFYLIYENKKAYFVSSTPNGNIVMVDEAGNVKTKEAFDLSPNHYFLTCFLNNNDIPDFVFTDQGELKILYDWDKKFNYDFESEIAAPLFFQFSNQNNKIGITDYKNEEIYLFNSNGTLYKDFPLKGLTPFSISLMNNKTHRFNLMTGGTDGFLFNYEVP